MIRAGVLVKNCIPALTSMEGVEEMYLAASVGGRSVGGYGDGMMVGNGMPQPGGDGNAILEVVGQLLGGTLLHMPRDAIELEDVASHTEFSSCIGHSIILI